ncbi:MAG: response regulator [Bauldia sp.]|nr:response regulator [Bauldia sp.]
MSPAASKAVLIADDDTLVVEVVKNKLRRQGYRVASATDGMSALAAVTETRPDLVILDAMMPVHDGYHVLREMKADPVLAAIPVLMLSARKLESDRLTALALGADGYLLKPFSADELAVCVRSFFS